MRNVAKVSYLDQLFVKYKCFIILIIVKLKTLIIIYNAQNKMLIEFFFVHNNRRNKFSLAPKPRELCLSGFHLSVPRFKTNTGNRAFSVAVPTLWNTPIEQVKLFK